MIHYTTPLGIRYAKDSAKTAQLYNVSCQQGEMSHKFNDTKDTCIKCSECSKRKKFRNNMRRIFVTLNRL